MIQVAPVERFLSRYLLDHKCELIQVYALFL
jgi:hypothetical protein